MPLTRTLFLLLSVFFIFPTSVWAFTCKTAAGVTVPAGGEVPMFTLPWTLLSELTATLLWTSQKALAVMTNIRPPISIMFRYNQDRPSEDY